MAQTIETLAFDEAGRILKQRITAKPAEMPEPFIELVNDIVRAIEYFD